MWKTDLLDQFFVQGILDEVGKSFALCGRLRKGILKNTIASVQPVGDVSFLDEEKHFT